MRILAMSDVHGRFDVYRWMRHLAGEHGVDAVVLAGDLLHGAGDDESIEVSQRREGDRLLELLREVPCPVFYIMGNDDAVSLDYEDERIRPLHGRIEALGGYEFLGYQYSPPFMGGIHEKPESEIGREVGALEPLMHARTVFVTHAPALGFRDTTFLGESVGSASLLKAMERRKVRAHIHGHIHHSFGRDGIHFNVASGRHFRAMSIDLDEMRHSILRPEGGSSPD